jgi:microcompartment protein CcmL/EutN
MVGMLAGFPQGIEQADLMAAKAYRWADAMLKAREVE